MKGRKEDEYHPEATSRAREEKRGRERMNIIRRQPAERARERERRRGGERG
jgi:hypothetical protein